MSSPNVQRIQPRRSSTSTSTSTPNAIASSSTATIDPPRKTRTAQQNVPAALDAHKEARRQAGSSSIPHIATTPNDFKGTGKGKGKEKEVPKDAATLTPESKQPERRVLPARIRRSAGGGEGMREIEEMIIDWLERWGEPSSTPPDDLPVYLTSIPLSYIDPPPSSARTTPHLQMNITHTPTRKKSIGDARFSPGAQKDMPTQTQKIEVPDWVMIKPGEDDQEEAREELSSGAKGLTSPIKRLRRGGIGIGLGDEAEEDTSDAFYANLHRKYEVFEKRQKIREKEKLQFERYKMKSRLDLLKNIPKLNWTVIVSTILQRVYIWQKGKAKIQEKGEDWLKRQLIKEGEEVMRRFDELLPPEQRKPKATSSNPSQPDSRLSTPSRASLSPSLTPPPAILPARVAALRDPSTSSANKRKRRSSAATADVASQPKMESEGESPSKSVRSTRTSNRILGLGFSAPETPPPGLDTPSASASASRPKRTSHVMMASSSGQDDRPGISKDTNRDGDVHMQAEIEEGPDSSQEIIKPTPSKSRRILPPEIPNRPVPPRSAQEIVLDPVKKRAGLTAIPTKSKFISHTQQSIKAFFSRPNAKTKTDTFAAIAPAQTNMVKPVNIAPRLPTATTQPALPTSITSTANKGASLSNASNDESRRAGTSTKAGLTTNGISTSVAKTRGTGENGPQAVMRSKSGSGSGLPCLLEAASRRESWDMQLPSSIAHNSQPRRGDNGVTAFDSGSRQKSHLIPGPDDQSHDIEDPQAHPFGVALPGRLEWQSEFTISDQEDFWPILASRKQASRKPDHNAKSESVNDNVKSRDNLSVSQHQSQPSSPPPIPMSTSMAPLSYIVQPPPQSEPQTYTQEYGQAKDDEMILTAEEVEELEGVEAAVVL
ncbi:uncharacterized protein I303_108631 [Kwoniella dejecticola CBS 10117]|uniref:Something about silencing protein 4 domain-containing protein n=1 Tax=Kwoniella dejecticola CBS 10117 TaxID=1296121 RepID=A0A1A5ZWU9_9TREE|nr:uncharacterized protein I303_07044 [Kwoniella dejecticola CBS 10117]OBR82285.1 hypothetical protein I303_07044 [Kwoniella dejecticola CBS 10117]